METENRNGAFDFFKLIASFSVITLHIHILNIPLSWQVHIRLLARWAVPFFFLVSGYFSYKAISGDLNIFISKKIDRLLGIFIIANIIYLLQRFLYFKELDFAELISFDTLVSGTYYHLWFISSMIFGFIIIWFMYLRKIDKYLSILSIIIILLILLSDSYKGILGVTLNPNVFRFFLSIPFIYLGIWIAKSDLKSINNTFSNIKVTYSLIMIVSGVVLQYIESRFLFSLTGYEPYSHQFLIGTIPFTLGLFILSKNIQINSKNVGAILGQKYSLGIYLYHLFFYFTIYQVFLRLINIFLPMLETWVQYFGPILIFLLSLLLLWIADKYLNPLFRIVTGDFSGRRRII